MPNNFLFFSKIVLCIRQYGKIWYNQITLQYGACALHYG